MGVDDDLVHLSDHVAVFRRQWRIIAVLTALGGFVGLALSMSQATAYVSEATVLVASRSTLDPGTPLKPDQVPTEAEFVLSDPMVAEVMSTLGTSLRAGQLRNAVTVEASTDTSVLVIRAQQPTADGAAALANAFAEEYVQFRTNESHSALMFLRTRIADLDSRIDKIRAKLPALDPGPRAVAEGTLSYLAVNRSDLNGRRLAARMAEAADSGGRVLTAATPSRAPAQPRPLFDIALGIVVGGIFGVLGAYLRNGGVGLGNGQSLGTVRKSGLILPGSPPTSAREGM